MVDTKNHYVHYAIIIKILLQVLKLVLHTCTSLKLLH